MADKIYVTGPFTLLPRDKKHADDGMFLLRLKPVTWMDQVKFVEDSL